MSTSADRFNPKSLALSGGGFRAAMFHLGVIGYLRKTARLEHITDIYAVSGGSMRPWCYGQFRTGILADPCFPHRQISA